MFLFLKQNDRANKFYQEKSIRKICQNARVVIQTASRCPLRKGAFTDSILEKSSNSDKRVSACASTQAAPDPF